MKKVIFVVIFSFSFNIKANDKLISQAKTIKFDEPKLYSLLENIKIYSAKHLSRCQGLKDKDDYDNCIDELLHFRKKVYLKLIQNKADDLDDKDLAFEEQSQVEESSIKLISP